MSKSRRSKAGSDESRGITGGRDAHASDAASPAHAHADSAKPKAKRRSSSKCAGRDPSGKEPPAKDSVAPGAPRNGFVEDYLPKDGLGFVEAVHRMVDLVGVANEVLRGDDAKMKQRQLEQLLDLAYGKNARQVREGETDEATAFFANVPGPERD